MTRISGHLEELQRLVALRGRRVVDVGAGGGAFAQSLAAEGADVVAIEIDDAKVAAIRELGADAVVAMKGTAEDMPLEDASRDLATFMFSFHHVPLDLQDEALEETHRVLAPGGRLHVADPLPGGPLADIMRPIYDETEVRTRSQERLAQLDGARFRLVEKDVYAIARHYHGPDHVIASIVAVDPARAARLPAVEAEVRARIAELAADGEAGLRVTQPCALFHFERI